MSNNLIVVLNDGTQFKLVGNNADSVEVIAKAFGTPISGTATTKATVQSKDLPTVYTVKGLNVTVGGDGFIPKKVFYAVTATIKENGGKWDNTNKVWKFENKTALGKFEKAWKNGKK